MLHFVNQIDKIWFIPVHALDPNLNLIFKSAFTVTARVCKYGDASSHRILVTVMAPSFFKTHPPALTTKLDLFSPQNCCGPI